MLQRFIVSQKRKSDGDGQKRARHGAETRLVGDGDSQGSAIGTAE